MRASPAPACAFHRTAQTLFVPTPVPGWVDEETGRWRLRGSRESKIMEDAGRTVGASRHRPVPAALPADKARKATSFSAFCRRRRAGSGWHGPSEPDQPARRRGSALQSWPDSGISRLHRIGGTWGRRRCRAQARQAPSRNPGHFHGVPIPSVPLVTPGGWLRKKHSRRVRPPLGQAVGVDGGVRSRVVPAPAADASFR